MKKIVALVAGAAILSGCGGSGGGGTTTSSAVSGLEMPESMSVVVAQDDANPAPQSQSLMAVVRDVSGFPASSHYNTDDVHSYVFDESMESLNTVNMILCLMEQTRATDMVNQGAYIALVNEDKCEQGQNGNGGQQSTGQSSGGEATEFNNWTILSTRASSDDPQLVKIWVPGEDSSDPMDSQSILVEVSVSEGVSSTAPFGSFVMNFKGVADVNGNTVSTMSGTLRTVPNDLGQPHFNFVNVGGDALPDISGMNFSFEESSDVILDDADGTGGVALTHNSRSESSQGGSFSETSTYAVAFNDSYLYRGEDENDDDTISGQEAKQCTSRTDFNTNVWRYNLYHAVDGTFNGKTVTAGQRVELNSGFPFEYDSDDDSVNDAYGWIGYHGIWSEGGTIADNSVITEFDYSNDTTKEHTVHVSNGKLIRRTANTIALSELQGEEFQWWGMHPSLNIDGQWIVTPGSGNDKFDITASHSWGENGPSTSSTVDHDNNPETTEVAVAATITLQDKEWIGFWSEALGGNLDYVYDVAEAEPVAKFFGQEFVSPSDAVFANGSITLHCYERCLIGGIDQPAVDAAADFGGGGQGENDLYRDYQGTPFQYSLSITNGKMVLTDLLNDLPVSMVGLDLSALGHDWGFHTGEMVTTALSDDNSPWLIHDEAVTYSWETGDNEWNRLVTVTDANGDFTSFDPPLSFSYTHDAVVNDENDATTSNAYDGSKFLLEYGGVGQLWGFPWVASDTDEQGNPQGRWYPAVTLKDGVELSKDSAIFVVKAVEKEQTMKSVDESNCNTGANALNIDQLFNQLTLPTVTDIGTVSFTLAEKPDVTDAPAVIEGELQ